MINKQFEVYKIQREIKRSGKCFEFYRTLVNDFGEPSDFSDVICCLKGLYHEQNSYVKVSMNENIQFRNKKMPMILCLYEDVIDKIKLGDFVIFNKRTYKVADVTNVQEWNLIADISLEVVDDVT